MGGQGGGLGWPLPVPGEGVWRVLAQIAPSWDPHGPEMLPFAFFSGKKEKGIPASKLPPSTVVK